MQLSELIRRYLLYGLSGPIIVLNLWVLSQVFQYFEGLITFLILSIILALILDYLVRLFERFRLNRTQAVLLVLFLFLVTLVILGFTLLPIVIGQATQLLQGLPALLEAGNRNINWLQSFINQHKLPFDLDQITNQVNNQVQAGIAELPELAINTVGQIFATILLIVLAFYMLLYGERCWKGLTNLLPSKLGNALSTSLKQQFHQFFFEPTVAGAGDGAVSDSDVFDFADQVCAAICADHWPAGSGTAVWSHGWHRLGDAAGVWPTGISARCAGGGC